MPFSLPLGHYCMRLTPLKDVSQDLKQPVSRWELIDAIAKLYTIQDCPQQLIGVRNKSKTRCCAQLTQVGQNPDERSA